MPWLRKWEEAKEWMRGRGIRISMKSDYIIWLWWLIESEVWPLTRSSSKHKVTLTLNARGIDILHVCFVVSLNNLEMENGAPSRIHVGKRTLLQTLHANNLVSTFMLPNLLLKSNFLSLGRSLMIHFNFSTSLSLLL
jgi:hypothetical protein